MFGAGVHLQLFEHLAAEAVLREHAFYGVLDNESRLLDSDVLRRDNGDATRVTRVAEVLLVGFLGAGETGFVGVHNDNEITRVDVWRIRGLMLAAKNGGDLRREPPDDQILSVNDVPHLIDFADLGTVRLKRIVIHENGMSPKASAN